MGRTFIQWIFLVFLVTAPAWADPDDAGEPSAAADIATWLKYKSKLEALRNQQAVDPTIRKSKTPQEIDSEIARVDETIGQKWRQGEQGERPVGDFTESSITNASASDAGGSGGASPAARVVGFPNSESVGASPRISDAPRGPSHSPGDSDDRASLTQGLEAGNASETAEPRRSPVTNNQNDTDGRLTEDVSSVSQVLGSLPTAGGTSLPVEKLPLFRKLASDTRVPPAIRENIGRLLESQRIEPREDAPAPTVRGPSKAAFSPTAPFPSTANAIETAVAPLMAARRDLTPAFATSLAALGESPAVTQSIDTAVAPPPLRWTAWDRLSTQLQRLLFAKNTQSMGSPIGSIVQRLAKFRPPWKVADFFGPPAVSTNPLASTGPWLALAALLVLAFARVRKTRPLFARTLSLGALVAGVVAIFGVTMPVPGDEPLLLSESSGNAEIYGGGDLLDEKIQGGRDRVARSLTLLRADFNTHMLCHPDACAGRHEPSLCQSIRELNEGERRGCRDFILAHLDQWASLLADPGSPVSLTHRSLLVDEGDGQKRPVGAMTNAGSSGVIYVHRPSVVLLSSQSLSALIVHELGHKITGAFAFVSDTAPAFGFATGRKLLDVVGAALAIYAEVHSMPRQAPTPVKNPDRVCPLAADTWARYFVGFSIDALGDVPTQDGIDQFRLHLPKSSHDLGAVAARLLASSSARSHFLTVLFREILSRDPAPYELSTVLSRLNMGEPHESIVASLMGDEEFIRTHNAHGPQSFVTTAYAHLVGKAPPPRKIGDFVRSLASMDRASVVLGIFKAGDASHQLARRWYLAYLNREPSPEELQISTSQLRSGVGWEAVRSSILSSPEYLALQSLRFRSCSPGR